MRRNIFYTALIVVGLALVVWAADPTKFTTLEVTGVSTLTGAVTATAGVTGALTGNVTGDVTGDLTGDVTGDLTGAVAATTITASSTSTLAGAVVCSSTVAVQGAASFSDSTYFGNDVVATTFTGALTGNVTGNLSGNVTGDLTGIAVQTVALKGNLPAAAAGNKFEIYANTAVDSVWISTGAAWTLICP